MFKFVIKAEKVVPWVLTSQTADIAVKIYNCAYNTITSPTKPANTGSYDYLEMVDMHTYTITGNFASAYPTECPLTGMAIQAVYGGSTADYQDALGNPPFLTNQVGSWLTDPTIGITLPVI